jgi:small subunit ribosomal protein S20
MRHALKSVRAAIDNASEQAEGSGDATKKVLRDTVSLIDRLVSKGVIHANAAARHKSRLTRRLQKTVAAA